MASCLQNTAVEQSVGMRVLIVDDNEDLADIMAMIISMKGHRTCAAYNADQGLRLALQFLPNVIFHDIALPGMSGYDAALRLRQDPRLRKTVLVAHTAYVTDADRARAKDVGFDYFIGKPLDPSMLDNLLTTLADAQGWETPSG